MGNRNYLRQRHSREEKIHKYTRCRFSSSKFWHGVSALGAVGEKIPNVAPSVAIDNGLGEVSANVFI